jgi:hypothetical protein
LDIPLEDDEGDAGETMKERKKRRLEDLKRRKIEELERRKRDLTPT